MINQNEIATALLSVELPNEEVAGLMLEMCDIKTPVKMPTAPCPASVERVAKRGWAKTATAVLSGTKEFLGKRLTKHTSVQIRRLLAEHSTDQEALRELHDWGLKKDLDTLKHTVRQLDAEWLLERLENGVEYPSRLLPTIGYRIAITGDAHLDRLAKLPDPLKYATLVPAAVVIIKNPTDRWNLEHLLQQGDSEFQLRVAQELSARLDGILTENMMRVVYANQVVMEHVEKNGFPRLSGYEPAAAKLLVALNPLHAISVIEKSWDDCLFDDIVGCGSFPVLDAFLGSEERIRSRSKEQVERVLGSIGPVQLVSNSYRPQTLNRHLLDFLSFELDTDLLLTYLRNTDDHATWQWLCGKYRQKPRPGEIAALSKDQGLAFGWTAVYGPSATTSRFAQASAEEIAADIAQRFEYIVNQDWCDELVDAFGSEVFEHLVRAYNPAGKDYLVARIGKELGTDPDIWRSALAHFGKSKLSVGKTLTAIRLLHNASTAPRV